MKTLLKPELKVIYLNNRVSEKVEYLEISPELGKKSLRLDRKNGAEHFAEVECFVEKKKHSRFVVVTADSKENGLMAISYMAACTRTGDVETEFEEYRLEYENPFEEKAPFEFDEDYAGTWRECENKIPVIDAGAIKSAMYQHHDSFEMGGFRMQQNNSMYQGRPYWADCKKESICIICDKFQADCMNSAALNLFKTNKRVYLLFIEENTNEFGMSDFPFGLECTTLDNIKNSIVLVNAADEICVSMEYMDKKKYYTNVIKQNFKERNIKVGRGFSYIRLINLALSVRKEAVCATLDLIVNYAMKDMDATSNITLKNEDFDFVDRFMRTEIKVEEEKAINRIHTELVGMQEVKEQVLDTINVMKYNKVRSNLSIRGSKYHNVHVMLGAPGTAKTTVAQLMGQMMVEEKLLPDNRFICVNGAELKGQYVGQSAPKTKALFDNYDVIIIDEAYSLTEGSRIDSFSTEAIAQLIIELEKHSTDKLVIFAGYGGKDISAKDNKMQSFLDANPGIKSRITSTFYFQSYSAKEMVEIFFRIAKMSDYDVEPETKPVIEQYFAKRVEDSDFGNGREARNLLETSVVFAAKRLMNSGKEDFSTEELKCLTTQDVRLAIKKLEDAFGIRKVTGERKIGFAGVY